MINAYGPRWRFSSERGGKFEMKVSIGMTNAAVFPEPKLGSANLSRKINELYAPVSAIPMMSRFCKPIGIACR